MTPHEERLAAEQRYQRTSDRLMQMLLSNRMREIEEERRLKAELEAQAKRQEMNAEKEGLARHHRWAGTGMQIGGMFGPIGAGIGAAVGGVAGTISEMDARRDFAHKYGKQGYDWGDALKDTHWRLPKESEWGAMAGGAGSLAQGLAREKAQQPAKFTGQQQFEQRQAAQGMTPEQYREAYQRITGQPSPSYDATNTYVPQSSRYGSSNYGTLNRQMRDPYYDPDSLFR